MKDNSIVYVVTQTSIHRLVAASMLDQLDQLVSEKKFDEALSLCENIPESDSCWKTIDKASKSRNIKMLFAYHLFASGYFDRSLGYFAELLMDPIEVLGLFPNLLPKSMASKHTYPSGIPSLSQSVLLKALQALVVYLLQIRSAYEKQDPSIAAKGNVSIGESGEYASCTDILTIVDTTLMRSYLDLDDPSLREFVQQKNNRIHVKEAERVLIGKKDYELVLLYKSKGMHEKALDHLLKLGKEGKPNQPLYGTSYLIEYLKELGREHLELILKYSIWIMRTTNEEALQIFTAKRSRPEEELPSEKIYEHIKENAPSLMVPYLEHSIHVRKETKSELHNELILQYLKRIQTMRKGNIQEGKPRLVAGTEPGLLGETRRKLIPFLADSQCYTPDSVISYFPRNDFFEERAILLSRMKQHREALQIYVHKLFDFEMAEGYCSRFYNPKKEDLKDIYFDLLKVFLTPPDGSNQLYVPQALSLLNKYHDRIDIVKALDILPPETPIAQLYYVFECLIRESNANRRTAQVVKNLLKSENLLVREQFVRVRSPSLKVTTDRMCPACNRRLGLSGLALYPNGVVVHYGCCKDREICPVTKTVFKMDVKINGSSSGGSSSSSENFSPSSKNISDSSVF